MNRLSLAALVVLGCGDGGGGSNDGGPGDADTDADTDTDTEVPGADPELTLGATWDLGVDTFVDFFTLPSPDGDLFLVDTNGADFGIAKRDPDGAIDATWRFPRTGTTADFASLQRRSVALLPAGDGTVYAGAAAPQEDGGMEVMRLAADGSRIWTTRLEYYGMSGFNTAVHDLAFDPAGNVILLGAPSEFSPIADPTNACQVVRLTPDGDVDPTLDLKMFGTLTTVGSCSALVVGEEGLYVHGIGEAPEGGGATSKMIVRIDETGEVDLAFAPIRWAEDLVAGVNPLDIAPGSLFLRNGRLQGFAEVQTGADRPGHVFLDYDAATGVGETSAVTDGSGAVAALGSGVLYTRVAVDEWGTSGPVEASWHADGDPFAPADLTIALESPAGGQNLNVLPSQPRGEANGGVTCALSVSRLTGEFQLRSVDVALTSPDCGP